MFSKVRRVFPMVIWFEFRMGQCRDNDHWEGAPHFSYVSNLCFQVNYRITWGICTLQLWLLGAIPWEILFGTFMLEYFSKSGCLYNNCVDLEIPCSWFHLLQLYFVQDDFGISGDTYKCKMNISFKLLRFCDFSRFGQKSSEYSWAIWAIKRLNCPKF